MRLLFSRFNGRSLQEVVDEAGELVQLRIHLTQQCYCLLVSLGAKAPCEQLPIGFHPGHRRLEFMAHPPSPMSLSDRDMGH
jgi:hypothetical protein